VGGLTGSPAQAGAKREDDTLLIPLLIVTLQRAETLCARRAASSRLSSAIDPISEKCAFDVPSSHHQAHIESNVTLKNESRRRMTAAAVDYEMNRSLSDHSGIQICGIASAVPEHCIDQAVRRDIILANAPEFRNAAAFQNTG
jgi:hypothetical protein